MAFRLAFFLVVERRFFFKKRLLIFNASCFFSFLNSTACIKSFQSKRQDFFYNNFEENTFHSNCDFYKKCLTFFQLIIKKCSGYCESETLFLYVACKDHLFPLTKYKYWMQMFYCYNESEKAQTSWLMMQQTGHIYVRK